jgi:hypothetical protein
MTTQDQAQRPAHDVQDLIARCLVEALDDLHRDLDRVELWTAALSSFQTPVPEYRPNDQNLLPTREQLQARR